MRTVKLAGKKVEIYDAVDEFPITRFHKYNKYLLIDVGVGADLANVDNHIERAMRFIAINPTHAIQELENLRQSIYLIQQEISPKYWAFAVLVKSIDGVEQNDLSDDGLRKILETLGSATATETDQILESVKKKIDSDLADYFPALFDDSTVKEYYNDLRNRTLMVLDEIISGVKKQDEIESITTKLITFTKPQIFWGKENVELNYDKQFESMCLLLSQQLHVQPKNFTVLEYYNAFMYLREQRKAEAKGKRKGGV